MSKDEPSCVPPSPLQQDLACLKGVTPLRLEQLNRLGLKTVGDLLYHFPRAYEDLTDIRPITALTEGKIQTVQGEVVEIDGKRLADGRCVVSIVLSDDGKHCLEGAWFNQPYITRRFRYGQHLAFSGKPKWFRDHWQMSTPRVQVLDDLPRSRIGPVSATLARSVSEGVSATLARSVSEGVSATLARSVSEGVSATLARSVSEGVSATLARSVSEGVSATLARSVSEGVSATLARSVSEGVSATLARSVSEGSQATLEVGIVPIYPLTEDLRLEQLRPLIRRVVDQYSHAVTEFLPEQLRRLRKLPDVHQALRDVHFPPSMPAAEAARRRFVYQEFLVLQIALGLRRRELRDRQQAPLLPTTAAIDARIRRLFPFKLTEDQDRAVAEICKDLAGSRPMQRLLQADVGAGKTAVAVYALLVTVANKHQAAIMAPTEVLARQHWYTLERYLAHSRVRRLLLTGVCQPASGARLSPPSARERSIWSSARRPWCRRTFTSPGLALWSSTSSTSSASISGRRFAVWASIPTIWS